MEGCCLPLEQLDERRKKKEDWAQSRLALQKAGNAFSASGRCLSYSCFSPCIIWHLNASLANV